MAQDIFADTFANIAVTGALVRIELGSLVAPQAGGDQPQIAVQQRLVMPIDGFLRSFGMAEDVINKMVAAGVVQKRTPGGEQLTTPATAAVAEDLKSPNFSS